MAAAIELQIGNERLVSTVRLSVEMTGTGAIGRAATTTTEADEATWYRNGHC